MTRTTKRTQRTRPEVAGARLLRLLVIASFSVSLLGGDGGWGWGGSGTEASSSPPPQQQLVRYLRHPTEAEAAAAEDDDSAAAAGGGRSSVTAYELEHGVFVFEESAAGSFAAAVTPSDPAPPQPLQQQQYHARRRRALQETLACTLWREDVYFNDQTSFTSYSASMSSSSSSSSAFVSEPHAGDEIDTAATVEAGEGESESGGGSIDKWTCVFENYLEPHSGMRYPHYVDIQLEEEEEAGRRLATDPFKHELERGGGAHSGRSRLQWSAPEDVTLDAAVTTLTLPASFGRRGHSSVTVVTPLPADDEHGGSDDPEHGGSDNKNNSNNIFVRRNLNRTLRTVQEQEQRRRQTTTTTPTTRTTGSKQTLVIRVVGDGIGPQATRQELYENIFGNGSTTTRSGEQEEDGTSSSTTTPTLRTQMAACSREQLRIVPYSGRTVGGKMADETTIANGVVELRIRTNPSTATEKQMENDVLLAATYVFGSLEAQFDLILFAMPPGLSPGFAAYAYINSPFSYYSNTVILDVMVQMHEVGHNIGLQHAGEDQEEYGDPSGYMGYARMTDPKMCYNAANNYRLGWYTQRSIRPVDDGDGYVEWGDYYLSGVAGYYDPNGPEASSNAGKIVSLRLEQTVVSHDYYIGYNWAAGINQDTQEDPDRVIIVQMNKSHNGDSSSEISWKVAALDVGESYTIQNYDQTGKYVTISFASIVGNDAKVTILPERVPSLPPTLPPSTLPPSTLPPTNRPTNRPTTAFPTKGPTTAPTIQPTTTPTKVPQPPSLSPISLPTNTSNDATDEDDYDEELCADTKDELIILSDNGKFTTATTCKNLKPSRCEWMIFAPPEEEDEEEQEQNDDERKLKPATASRMMVQNVCPVTCNTCPTQAPTPDRSHIVCEDNPSNDQIFIRYTDGINEGNFTERSCNFFSRNKKPTNQCNWSVKTISPNNATKIQHGRDVCPVSCETCPEGTCQDNTHDFVILDSNNITTAKPVKASCDWIEKSLIPRCDYETISGNVTTGLGRDECPVTCKSCPTLSPTLAPSSAPTEFCPSFQTDTNNETGTIAVELSIVTNSVPDTITWRLTEKESDEVIESVPRGTYFTANATEQVYLCLDLETDYRFKIWVNATGNNGKVSYEASYMDDSIMIVFENSQLFEEKTTELFTTVAEALTPSPSSQPTEQPSSPKTTEKDEVSTIAEVSSSLPEEVRPRQKIKVTSTDLILGSNTNNVY